MRHFLFASCALRLFRTDSCVLVRHAAASVNGNFITAYHASDA